MTAVEDGRLQGYMWVVIGKDRGGLRVGTLIPEFPAGPCTAWHAAGLGAVGGPGRQPAVHLAVGRLVRRLGPLGAGLGSEDGLFPHRRHRSALLQETPGDWKPGRANPQTGHTPAFPRTGGPPAVPTPGTAGAHDLPHGGPFLRVFVLCQLRTAVKTSLNKPHAVGF